MPFGYFENLVVSAHTPAINAQIRWQTINAMWLQRYTKPDAPSRLLLWLPRYGQRNIQIACNILLRQQLWQSVCSLVSSLGSSGWLGDLVDRSLNWPLLAAFFFCHCRLLLLALLIKLILLLVLLLCDLFHLAVVPSVFFHFVGN